MGAGMVVDGPLTRDEHLEAIAEFRTIYRGALIRHRASRLRLFFMLQFPEEGGDREHLLEDLDPLPTLDYAAPETIHRHKLFAAIRANVQQLMQEARAALVAAVQHAFGVEQFHALAAALRRLDLVLDRFDAALMASLTDVDELTGLFNRAALERDLVRELALAAKSQAPLCVAMIDADHFKRVNDSFGHAFGDVVLEELAVRFEAALRPQDRAYRYGGEEFVVILPATALPEALVVINRLRVLACATAIADAQHSVIQSVSAGVACRLPSTVANDVLGHADEALYRAKAAGRNRVMSTVCS